jgi:hypothetical protein
LENGKIDLLRIPLGESTLCRQQKKNTDPGQPNPAGWTTNCGYSDSDLIVLITHSKSLPNSGRFDLEFSDEQFRHTTDS